MTSSTHRRSAGFSLIEVMAAVMLLGVSMVVMLELRNRALQRAAEARNLSVAARLAQGLLHRIEGARVPDLFDGYTGDFSEEGYPDFIYVIGLGDGSAYANVALDENEFLWREQKVLEQEEADAEESEDGFEDKPPFTRIFLTVQYPSPAGEPSSYPLETVLPTWAVEQDFDLYAEQWADSFPEALE